MPEAGRLLPPDPPSKGRSLGVVLAVVGVLGIGAVAYAGLRGRSTARPDDATVTVSSASAAAPAPSASANGATISVFLSSDVPETSFRIDAEPPVASPYAGRLRRDEGAHVILATAPGYETARHELRFDADVVWKPTLKKIERSGAVAGGGAPVRGRGGPGPTPTSHASSQDLPVAPTSTPTATTAKPETSRRPVDEDNPYDKKKK